MKTKVEGDEIDSLNTLMNELYEKLQDMERGADPNNPSSGG